MNLPSSPDAERSILGGILLENGIGTHGLTPDQFYLDSHRRIFRMMLEMLSEKFPVDIISLANELASQKELEGVGGVAYLTSLTDGVPRRQSIEHHAKIVKDKWQLREIIRIANQAIADASREEKKGVELSRELETSFAGISQKSNTGHSLFVNAARFCATMPAEIEWLIENVIPVSSNGIISGEPKASKSWISDEIGLSLAMGEDFLGFGVPNPIRVGIFAREDYPGLTSWRINALFRSRVWRDPNRFGENLYINTRAQSDLLLIDNPEHVDEIIHSLLHHKIQFAIFDVLNILHEADENDNTEMRKVMNKFSYIQAKTGCSIAVVHHLGKIDGKWVRRLRGASSIHGWVEWLIGVSEAVPEARIRKMEFELKAAEAPDPVYYKIVSEKGSNLAQIQLCENPEVYQPARRGI